MRTAYSYLRFSSAQQAKGDTVRRQTEARDKWLADHPQVRLDPTLTLTDSGRSAFKRKDWDTYALARFVDLIKSGRVLPGSFLLVENLDRLSRENAGEATELFLSIVNKGVVIVQLSPVVMEFSRPVDMTSLMFAIVELSRGHSESAIKSDRGRASWANKRKHATERVMTRRLPGWFKRDAEGRAVIENGRPVLDPGRAAVVRRIFDMALAGKGVHAIAKALNEDAVPVMGRKVIARRGQLGKPPEEREKVDVKWNETVVYHILKNRATFGECQPGRFAEVKEAADGKEVVRWRRVPAGEPIAGYYPAVIERETYYAVATALKHRTRHGAGRRGKHINLLSGLLIDAMDGGSLTYKHLKDRPPTIIPVGAKQGHGSVWRSFPAAPLERAIRSQLVEVKAEDLGGEDTASRRVAALTARKAELEALMKAWEAKMNDPDIVDVVATKLSALNRELKDLNVELETAQREAGDRMAAAWGEFRTLATLDPDADTDAVRLRIKAALRRTIDSIRCVFAGVGRNRLAEVQVVFRGGEAFRSYFIVYGPGRSNHLRKRPGALAVLSLKHPEAAAAGLPFNTEDLRDPDQAACVLGYLESYPKDMIDRLLSAAGK